MEKQEKYHIKLAIPDVEDYFHIKLLENTDRLQTFVPTLI